MLTKTSYRKPLPSTVLILMAITSTQLGAALAQQLFAAVGYTGATSLSFSFAAILLLIWQKPNWQSCSRKQKALAIAVGVILAGMYLSLYAALDRIPLGIAIAFQFIGPLGLSAAKSCRRLDLIWVFLAALGITLISVSGQLIFHPVGAGLALLAGILLATYITLAAQMGLIFHKGEGLALAITVSAITLLPVTVNASSKLLLQPHLFLIGIGTGILSAVVPFSLDGIILKQTSTKTFGILLSLEPAIAALIGWSFLGQQLSIHSITGILLVSIAAAGYSRFQRAG